MKMLKKLCTSTLGGVFELLTTKYGFELVRNQRQLYCFRPGATNESPLIVCHADTVKNGGDGPHEYLQDGDDVISLALDDRLGIASMLHLIDSDSCLKNCAFLVCDEEEIGNSSAKSFAEDIKPAWMVELDRRGTDAVMYEYDNGILASMLMGVGFQIGMGSFSDICHLDSLGCCGFNIGIGYHNEHTENCYANLSDTRKQLTKLEDFYVRYNDLHIPYPFVTNSYDRYEDYSYGYSNYGSFDSSDSSSRGGAAIARMDAETRDDLDELEVCMALGKMTHEASVVFDKYGFDPEIDDVEDVIFNINSFFQE